MTQTLMQKTVRLLLLLAFSALPASKAAIAGTVADMTTKPDVQTIATLDTTRYMGTWYEIAKFPNRFQKQCVSNTSAVYTLRADNTIEVVNRCLTPTGDVSQATGQARPTGGPNTPKLQVRFAPAWLSFLPWVWGNYWVIDLDTDYQLVAVSEPTRDYLWILSRQKTVPDTALKALIQRLQKQGFDTNKLELSKQQ